jgi:lipoprotein-anchoring transpeptidase ErfK/SrfK
MHWRERKMKALIQCLLTLVMLLSREALAQSRQQIIVSTTDQRMYFYENGSRKASFPVSTSKFGLGSANRSFCTPLGLMAINRKVGEQMPEGTVFKALRPTGEVLRPNTPGRDPIVTRILCLSGLESQNANAASRCIYIHGTPEERNIGRPASYGCIRMRSRDIVKLFDRVDLGATVYVTPEHLRTSLIGASFSRW